MKKYKKILIILMLLILSGCTVRSNVIMDANGKIKEEVKILIPSSNISDNKSRIDGYIKTAIKSYEKALETRRYNYDIINDVEGESGALIYNNFDNFCSYVNSNIFSQYLYKNITCEENEYYYELKSNSPYITYCDDCNDRPALEDIKYSITLPVLAEENNADIVNDKTYTWEFNKMTSSDKSIHLKISKTKVEENYKNVKKQEDKKNNGSIIGIIIFIIILIIGVLLAINILYKKYKENKLEY